MYEWQKQIPKITYGDNWRDIAGYAMFGGQLSK